MLITLLDLGPSLGVSVKAGACIRMCGAGPNCKVRIPQPDADKVMLRLFGGLNQSKASKDLIASNVKTFDRCVDVLRQALSGAEVDIPAKLLHRTRLHSDSLRHIARGERGGGAQDLLAAEALLSEAITLEEQRFVEVGSVRSNDLRMLRAGVLAHPCLMNLDDALADCDAVLCRQPGHIHAHVKRALILQRARRPKEAHAAYTQTLPLLSVELQNKEMQSSIARHKLHIEKQINRLEDRLSDLAVVGRSEFGCSDAGDPACTDSGDGSGRWKVVKIDGLSWNTCVYRLEHHAPALPHPFPNDVWTVRVRLGGSVREYTPISTVQDWKRGKLDLLVKTYPDGLVSSRFATLQEAGSKHTSLEEQSCWALVSPPRASLLLSRQEMQFNGSGEQILELGLAVGGTGITPALQILQKVVDQRHCFSQINKAVLIYSSRAPLDVLLLDELRRLVEKASGRIIVRHTLTRTSNGEETSSAESRLPQINDVHRYFKMPWAPSKFEKGPLRTGAGEEASLRGRVDRDMLFDLLPKPGPSTRVVICGPPGMANVLGEMLASLEHEASNVIKLSDRRQSEHSTEAV